MLGYGPDLVALLSDDTLLKHGGDQLAFSKLFLDQQRRDKYGMRVDNTAELLQNIAGVEGTEHSSKQMCDGCVC